MKLSFCGSVNYKNYISKYITDEIIILDDNDFSNADIIYWIFGPGPDMVNFFSQWLNPHKKIIIHWIGSDVLYLKEKLTTSKIRKKAYYLIWLFINNRQSMQKKVFHFASSKWLVTELKDMGIKSSYLPISSIDDNFLSTECGNSERQFDFYAYFPYYSPEIYSGKLILEIARRMPERKFVFVHPDLTDNDVKTLDYPANVTAFPKQTHEEILKIFRQTKCLLRLTRHDGLSMGVLEALASQMQVLWTYVYPHTIKIDLSDIPAIEKTMTDVITNWQCNLEGKQYVSDNFNSAAIRAIYDNALNNKFIQSDMTVSSQ